jgi:hypothetical protein
MSRLANNSSFAKHGLKHLAKIFLSIDMPEFRELFVRRKRGVVKSREKIRNSTRKGIPTVLGLTWSTVPAGTELLNLAEIDRGEHGSELQATLEKYALLDATSTLRIHSILREKLLAIPA